MEKQQYECRVIVHVTVVTGQERGDCVLNGAALNNSVNVG
jgi:hypothetical protein